MKVMTHDVFDSSQPVREHWTCVPGEPVRCESHHLHLHLRRSEMKKCRCYSERRAVRSVRLR
jgi:hypothetical protein